MRLKLITLSGMRIDKDVYEVMIPTKAGEIAVYGGHAPLIGVLSYGIIHVREEKSVKDADRHATAVFGGTIKVLDNELIILADEVEDLENLREDEITKALERAKSLKKLAKDQVSLEHAQEMIDRQTVRLQLSGLKRRHRSKRN
ncbi:ATP synthase F1 subunit epsilon [Candidatus Saccharibacteria bacterium RIFCSPHIGHO2_12_FULL_41_12]|nr:MAG: ATP synthase F1 subunit epsilon [Candidatus Saccharibacteria bacterium RIFCSPHIGHO2_12_FULL_41_12]